MGLCRWQGSAGRAVPTPCRASEPPRLEKPAEEGSLLAGKTHREQRVFRLRVLLVGWEKFLSRGTGRHHPELRCAQ